MKKVIFIIFISIFIFSCDLLKKDLPNSELDLDTDSDGDGWSDFAELNDYGFNAENDPYNYNPYIADVPKINIEFLSLPIIKVIYTNNQSQTTEVSTEDSVTQETMNTINNTSTVSRGIEHSAGVTFGSNISVETGVTGGVTVGASIEYNYQFTHTQETSNSLSKEQSTSYAETYANILTKSQTVGYSYSGGTLTYSVRIVNSGNIAYSIQNLTINAFKYANDQKIPIAEMTRGGTNNFPETPLRSQESVDLIFSCELTLEETLGLLKNSNNLCGEVASYNLTNEDGKSYAVSTGTDITAKTSFIMVDYGPGSEKQILKYNVATNYRDEEITLADIFTDILHLEYSEENFLINIGGDKGVTANPENGSWIIYHKYKVLGDIEAKLYSPVKYYSLSQISVKPQDDVLIFFSEDKDLDGLTAREEFIYGCNDNLVDTDGDGVSDFEEVKNGTSPIMKPEEEVIIKDLTPDPEDIEIKAPSGFTFKSKRSVLSDSDTRTVSKSTLNWIDPIETRLVAGYIVLVKNSAFLENENLVDTNVYIVGGDVGNSKVLGLTIESSYIHNIEEDWKDYYYRIYSYDRDYNYSIPLESGVSIPKPKKIRLSLVINRMYIDDGEDGESGDDELRLDVNFTTPGNWYPLVRGDDFFQGTGDIKNHDNFSIDEKAGHISINYQC